MNNIERKMRSLVQHYHHTKYWKLRERVVNPLNKYPKLLKLWWLYGLKRSDAFNNASLGTHLNYGATFKTPPKFPHGIYGVIVTHNAVIGSNCTIFHQVTIGEGRGGAPVIGDNCCIFPGAKVVGNVEIGDNVNIGANCVIVENIPDNATVVVEKTRVIVQENRKV